MRSQQVLGLVLLLVGIALLYLLRETLVSLILLILGIIGILIAFALIVAGLGMIFWSRGWRRWGY